MTTRQFVRDFYEKDVVVPTRYYAIVFLLSGLALLMRIDCSYVTYCDPSAAEVILNWIEPLCLLPQIALYQRVATRTTATFLVLMGCYRFMVLDDNKGIHYAIVLMTICVGGVLFPARIKIVPAAQRSKRLLLLLLWMLIVAAVAMAMPVTASVLILAATLSSFLKCMISKDKRKMSVEELEEIRRVSFTRDNEEEGKSEKSREGPRLLSPAQIKGFGALLLLSMSVLCFCDQLVIVFASQQMVPVVAFCLGAAGASLALQAIVASRGMALNKFVIGVFYGLLMLCYTLAGLLVNPAFFTTDVTPLNGDEQFYHALFGLILMLAASAVIFMRYHTVLSALPCCTAMTTMQDELNDLHGVPLLLEPRVVNGMMVV